MPARLALRRTTVTAVGIALALAGTALGFACAPGSSPPSEAAAPSAEAMPKLLENLGDHTHPITTSSAAAQRYFDQGLILGFGFNHEAAVASFEAARRLDPTCAMCAWGTALALGPNINLPMGADAGRRAYAASRAALALAGDASERERAYIEALAVRYVAEPPEDRSALDRAYADAMRELVAGDPSDLDAATLLAESLMDLYPWNYWTAEATPREHTTEILALLEGVMKRDPKHVGANHFYIHAVEEYFPERGVPAAERLGDIATDAGHLVHMPSHIFWRVGRYDEALELNQRAAAADEAFFSWCRPGPFYRAAYYPHNVHFLWAAASAEGRSQIALTSARKLEAKSAERLAEFAFLEEFMAIPAFTLARFGRWDALLATPRPDEAHRYLSGVWHYTRGLALVRTDRPSEASAELDALAAVAGEPAVQALQVSGGVATASLLLRIGHAHLAGELAAVHGEADAAIGSLENAVALQDGVPYMEPPPWYFPTRQALGALLLDAGRAGDAEAVYRKDLEQHPANGWSLFGLSESLRAQGKAAETAWARQGFEAAWARADVELTASRF